jgi:hypothetical protein
VPTEQGYRTVDKFDRLMGALVGLPDVTHTKPSTITSVEPFVGEALTFIVQTYRQREVGDTIFLQVASSEGLVRVAITPAAADAIARQRDALTTQVRRKVGRATAAARKARGEEPAFLKARRARKKPKSGGNPGE